MKTPVPFLRGRVWCADLRPWGGQRRHSLGIPDGSDPIAVGMALQRALDGLRLGATVATPELPGLSGDPLLVRDLVSRYQDVKLSNCLTDGGASYVAGQCRRIVRDLGALPASALMGAAGEVALGKWRDRLWAARLSNGTVNNVLHQILAILRWARSEGRRFVAGELPEMPTAIRRGQTLRRLCFDRWPEADFRMLRDHAFDEALRTGGLLKVCGGDPRVVDDYIGRRQLFLSFSFYTGSHVADCAALVPERLSVDVGRYERWNQKSAAHVGPQWLDMPEQLQLDCEAELRRLGRRWRDGELVTGGSWRGSLRMLEKARQRLFPPDRCPPRWNFMSVARRSCVWEYTVRGWRTHEIATVLGHVDDRMVREVYRRCTELGIVSPVRVPWTVASGPHGGPSETGKVLRFGRGA